MDDIRTLLEKYADEYLVTGNVTIPDSMFFPPPPVRNTPITARENYLRVCRREKPVFMPIDTDEMMFSPRIIPDAQARAFVIDAEPETLPPGGKDMFGVDWVFVEEVGGSMVQPGSPKVPDIDEWEKYITFPDIETWDWKGSSEKNKNYFNDRFAMNIWIMNGLFERLISFLDFENAAVAIIDEDQQEAVARLFDRLADLYERMLDKIAASYPIDVLYFHDDWGSQRAPFFSPAVCREMIAPYLKRVVDAAHRNGMIFNFHSCGKQEVLVPVMIECGVDVWCGQPMNDFKSMYDKYGKDICLGITYSPPGVDASLEEVEKSCREFLNEYSGNGYVFPVIYEMEYSDKWFPVMYSLSRELYKN